MFTSSPSEPLNLTTTSLHRTAISSLSLPPQLPPTHPINDPPDSIPHFKLIPKTRFIIDCFKTTDPNFSTSYFLSHFHSDHYTGLTPQWTKGIIFCSPTTGILLQKILKIPEPFIFALPLSQNVLIDGVEVTLVDANHCPGAVQFLFKVPDFGKNSDNNLTNMIQFEKYVHTGDFRFSNEMKNESLLYDFVGADAVFLDTTYCNPKFVFPSQEESIDYIVGVINGRKCMENEDVQKNVKNVLFLVATYVVGKERILLEISRRCKRKIHVNGRKIEVLNALGLGHSGVFTEDESESDVHVVGWNVLGETWPYFRPNFVKMKEIMIEKGYSKVVGFVPTGWTYEVKRNKFAVRTKDSFEVHLVPYSEHSNYEELREYVKFLKPKCVIPTVGADVEKIDSKHADKMRRHFSGLVDEKAIKQEFLMSFHCGGASEVHEDIGMDCTAVSDIAQMQEDEAELQSDIKSSIPQQEYASHGSDDLRESDLEESMQEIRDCLPSWVTRLQMLTLLGGSRGNVVEAVSNFYEYETKFHEEVLPSTSVSCTFQESSENQPALQFESQSVKIMNPSEDVSFSQQFKLSCSTNSKKTVNPPGNLKKTVASAGKRKRNLDSKATKRSKADSTQKSSNSKQYSITKFFEKKVLVLEDNKAESEVAQSSDDQGTSSNNATKPYREELDNFITIVNGCESLRSYAATIIEKAKGDVNMALDLYYNENTDTYNNETKEELLEISNLTEAECASRNSELLDSKNLEIKSDICFPVLSKDDVPGNYVSLPPDKYSPIRHACWKKGQPAPYIHIAHTFALVEEEKGKLKATSMLCNMFRSLLALSPEDVLPTLYLCTNKIAPDHENMELNIGGSIVVAALEEACGTNRSKINNLYNSLGDLVNQVMLLKFAGKLNH